MNRIALLALAACTTNAVPGGAVLIEDEPTTDTGTVPVDTGTPPEPVDTGTPPAEDTGSPLPYEGYPFTAQDIEDWGPLQAGNWPNTLTADECGEDGPTCFDCIHLPTGTYGRWYLDESGQWFEAILGTVEFSEDFDYEVGSGLGEDGVYYAVDTMTACLPFYELYAR